MQSTTDIVVVGGGVAGLVVALELQRQGMQTMQDVVVLDAESGPGGSWGRAWDRLPLRMARDLAEPDGLSDFDLGFDSADPDALVRDVVPRSLAYYEDASNLYVYRPARVVRVTSPRRSRRLNVEYIGPTGRRSTIVCRILIDATGHWSSPFVPWVPGMREFTGRHVAAAHLERLTELDGKRVVVVGGGRTAVDLLQLLEGRTESLAWATRRAPDFRAIDHATAPGGVDVASGSAVPADRTAPSNDDREAEAGLSRQTPGRTVWPGRAGSERGTVTRPWAPHEEGRRPVSERAWIPRTPAIEAAIDRGLLRSRGVVRSFDGGVVEFERGERSDVDVVVWATGSHVPLRHLAPLRLRDPSTNYRARSGWNRRDRRVAIVGDGTDVSSREALEHAVEIADDAVDSLDDIERA